MTEVYLISPNFIRTFTNVSSNLQDKFLQSSIREAQDIDFTEVVGDHLCNKLKELVDDETIKNPENAIYKSILDKAKYFLAYSVISRITVISSIKLDNIGANMTSDENVDNLDVNDVFKLEQFYRNKADVYKLKLQKFLRKNINNIPELYNNCNCCETGANINSMATTGLWLGGERGKSYTQKYIKKDYELL